MIRFSLILFFIFTLGLLSQNSTIEILHERVGNEISKSERDYFGLFPEINDFKSAQLLKDNSNQSYFNLFYGTSNRKFSVTDSSIYYLRLIIENFETIINQDSISHININAEYIKDFIQVGIRYFPSAPPLDIKKTDKEEISGKLIYFDNYKVGLFPSDLKYNYKTAGNYIRFIEVNKIDICKQLDYPVIKGDNDIFESNNSSLSDYEIFQHVLKNNIYPPEVIDRANEIKNDTNEITKYNSELDDLYLQRFIITGFGNFQKFNLNSSLLFLSDLPSTANRYDVYVMKFLPIYSYGGGLGYKITHRISLTGKYQFYNFEVDFAGSINQYYGKSYSLNIDYSVWNSEKYLFLKNQIFLDLFSEIQMVKLSFSTPFEMEKQVFEQEILNEDITNNEFLNLILGLSAKYKFNLSDIISFNFFISDFISPGRFEYSGIITSKKINYILSYGLGLVLEMNF